jgi:Pyruvate/2-oxoacid:ferredoxin oxidoreductase delta subunit
MAKGLIPQVDLKMCMSCMICTIACPFSCLEMVKSVKDNKKTFPNLVKVDSCTGCEICMKTCPIDCIRMVNRE